MNAYSNYNCERMLNGSFALRWVKPATKPIRVRTDVSATEQADLLRIARARLLRFKSRIL